MLNSHRLSECWKHGRGERQHLDKETDPPVSLCSFDLDVFAGPESNVSIDGVRYRSNQRHVQADQADEFEEYHVFGPSLLAVLYSSRLSHPSIQEC